MPTGVEEVAAIKEQQEAARSSTESRTAFDGGDVLYNWLDSTPSFTSLTPIPCQGSHAELRPLRADGRRSLSSIHATPIPRGHAARKRPRKERRSHHGGCRRCRSHAPREADRTRLLACCSGKMDGGDKLLSCCSGVLRRAGHRKRDESASMDWLRKS